jgi:hypothetical protein
MMNNDEVAELKEILYQKESELENLRHQVELLLKNPKGRHLIAPALAKAQGEMRVAAFNTSNAFLKNKYANLESVLDAIREILSRHEIVHTEYVDYIDDKPYLIVELIHSSGQSLCSKLKLEPKENTPQCLGGLLTYFRRYLISGLCSITQGAEPDDDGEKAMARISSEQLTEIKSLIGNDQKLRQSVLNLAKVDKFENVSTNDFEGLIQFIQKNKKPVLSGEKIGKAQLQTLEMLIGDDIKTLDKILDTYEIKNIEHLPIEHYVKLVDWLEKRIAKKLIKEQENENH